MFIGQTFLIGNRRSDSDSSVGTPVRRGQANDDFGIELGALGMRGERGVLFNGVDIATVRISSNPFFPYVAERIAVVIAQER